MTDTVDEAPSACPSCPNCESQYSYQVADLKVCTECGHEWAPGVPSEAAVATEPPPHAASVIDELKSKGSSLVGKLPTVVKKS